VAIGKDGAVLRQLRTLFNVGTVRDLTDGQLLERFATDRGESAELAFAVLVERHGPMVLRVCRGVLADPHDTQDAFQATFLVLVRKARALWVRDSLGPWLHQVAYRTASCARSTDARRRRLERRAAISVEAARVEPVDELERVLHEEIDRLPDRYRAPVVLCDLEGRTHEQVARHLGWPVGTVKSRLSRGRERLRDRLLRRGLTPDAGLIASTLSFDSSMASISTALVDSTAGAATRFLTVQSIVRGSAASLAQGVLRSMTMTRWLKAASVLLVAGATVAGVDLLAQRGTSGAQSQPEPKPKAALVVHEVKPGKLRVEIVERGSLESSRNQDVYSNVEGRTTIIKIVPEGAKVKKGEVICQLDSAALRDSLINQRITARAAEAAYENAKLAHEVAQLAITEYKEGIYKQELSAVKGEIATVQSAIQRAESRLERTRQGRRRLNEILARKGSAMTPDDIVTDLDVDDRVAATEQTLVRDRIALELLQAKQDVLQKYTRDKMIKVLEIDLERKHAEELAKRATWDLEKSKEAKLERQIAACTLVAPSAGWVVYANDPARGIGNNPPQIEEGATVRERQKILSIPDLSRMQVNTKVHESQVDKLAPNMKAKVRVDAFVDQLFNGVVLDVAPLPDPGPFYSQSIKVYTTHIRIDDPISSLRPGMTVQVEILVTERDDVLSVPVQAVLLYDGKDQVAVKKPGGGFEWRDVDLGISNEKEVEVKAGIRSGEAVILNPIDLLTEEEKRAKFSTPTKPAARGKGRAKSAPKAKTPP
jgi:HlyD family secretion protein